MSDDAIRYVLARYCHLCDDGDFGAMAELFTPDGVIDAMGTVVNDRAQIVAMMERVYPDAMRGMHSFVNVEIDRSEFGARVTSDMQFVRRTPAGPFLHAIARCVDEFVCADGQWHIARRVLRIAPDGRAS